MGGPYLTNDLDFRAFRTVFEEFTTWLDETHPEDLPLMIDLSVSGPLHEPRVTDETIELWERYTKEFAASVSD